MLKHADLRAALLQGVWMPDCFTPCHGGIAKVLVLSTFVLANALRDDSRQWVGNVFRWGEGCYYMLLVCLIHALGGGFGPPWGTTAGLLCCKRMMERPKWYLSRRGVRLTSGVWNYMCWWPLMAMETLSGFRSSSARIKKVVAPWAMGEVPRIYWVVAGSRRWPARVLVGIMWWRRWHRLMPLRTTCHAKLHEPRRVGKEQLHQISPTWEDPGARIGAVLGAQDPCHVWNESILQHLVASCFGLWDNSLVTRCAQDFLADCCSNTDYDEFLRAVTPLSEPYIVHGRPGFTLVGGMNRLKELATSSSNVSRCKCNHIYFYDVYVSISLLYGPFGNW